MCLESMSRWNLVASGGFLNERAPLPPRQWTYSPRRIKERIKWMKKVLTREWDKRGKWARSESAPRRRFHCAAQRPFGTWSLPTTWSGPSVSSFLWSMGLSHRYWLTTMQSNFTHFFFICKPRLIEAVFGMSSSTVGRPDKYMHIHQQNLLILRKTVGFQRIFPWFIERGR